MKKVLNSEAGDKRMEAPRSLAEVLKDMAEMMDVMFGAVEMVLTSVTNGCGKEVQS